MPKKIWAVGEKMFDAELENFKRKICLQSYAAAYGYTKDRSQSWASCTVMRHVNGDKIFIGVVNGYQVYWSPHDDNDKGTIIEFVQRRLRLSLGAVRKELRPWMGEPPVVVPVFTPLRESTRDRAKMEAAYAPEHGGKSRPLA